MSSTTVLNPTPTPTSALDVEVPVFTNTVEHGTTFTSKAASWRQEAAKFNMGLSSLLDAKAAPDDVEAVNNYVQPVDRGPDDGVTLRSWQYQVTGKVAAAQVLQELNARNIKSGGVAGVQAEAVQYISQHKLDDTFYIYDLGNTLRMLKAWRAAMPRVTPFYAVKCNPEPGLVKLLVAMGTGFDCASKGELDMMLKMGVHPSRIIFAHPTKRPCDIRYARDHGIQYTTFDSESELHKMAALNPDFKCVLRIRADDPDARVPLGLKYGADMTDVPRLLATAKTLGMDIVGVSFHVGSACKNLATFSTAIEKAREIFDQAEAMGFNMELLDIGGGFTGRFDSHGNVMFGEIANTINTSIAKFFPPELGVRVIAEPGRYFAETSGSLLTPVYGQRDRVDAVTGKLRKDYWLTDGLYGSFNCIIYDGQNPEYSVVRSPLLPEVKEEGPKFNSTLWGPTCDSADCIYKEQPLPQLRNGDWLFFPNAGAYTVAGACDFNGIEFTTPSKFYIVSQSPVDAVEEADASAEEMAA